jgi:ligand-binding sensor domain-containing protein
MTDTRHPQRRYPGHWRRLDHQHGLSHDCRCALVDRENRLWAGSRRMGLTCYDGTEFRNYTVADGLPDNYVRRLCEDAHGVLWVGTHHGLASFDGDRFTTHRFPRDHPNSVRALLATADGRLLVGGQRGLYECRDGALVQIAHEDTGPVSVRALAEDHDGALWVGLGTGARKITRGGVEAFDAASGLSCDLVMCLAVDANGHVWAGTHGGGVNHYDGATWRAYTVADGLPDTRVACVGIAPDGALWVGTAFDGAARFEGDGFTAYTTRDGLAHNSVHDMTTDLEGGIWFACWHGGLSRLQPSVTLLTECPVQESMIRDPEGRLWWGSGAALHSDGTGSGRAYAMPDRIQCILADSRGGLWVGTYLGGVYRFPDRARLSEPQSVYPAVEDGGPSSMALCEDRDGAVWMGCDQGLWWNDGASVRKFTVEDGLPTNHVTTVCATEDGAVWCGGYNGGGIGRYDGESWAVYGEADGLPDGSVLDIAEGAGRIWVGTRKGFGSFDGDAFSAVTAEGGLPDAAVKRIVVTDGGQLWGATLGAGVIRYDGVNITVLTEDDGLPSNHVCDMTAEPGGSIVLATYRGICQYGSAAAHPPGVRILAAESRERANPPTAVEVPAGSPLRVLFAGASLNTTRMRYAYILRGRDGVWAGTWEESVRYDDLPVGEYTLQVVAINRDLVVSDVPTSRRRWR